MTTTNVHGPKRAILYARVSTDEQARSGYSLAQQLEALGQYAAREGYEVLEEISDPGQSGASLERPGMDRVRDLVASGGVSVVLAQDRDHFAREPAYHYLLRHEFDEHGTTMRALNDRGDDSPEGELTDGILDQLAKYERAKIAERSRRGKLRKAKEGKVIPTHTADYGFMFNAARDGYEVDEQTMPIVRRIFYLVGVEGLHMHRVKKLFDGEGISPPKGGRYWSKQFVRSRIMDDVYKPHTFDEVKKLVASDVAAKLEPEKSYGIWWYNVRRTTAKQVVETDADGRRYRRRATTVIKPRDEWVAVPVPDAGISREWVDAARDAVKDNRVPSSAGYRFWELSGGIFCCGGCSRRMLTNTVNPVREHHYYRCPTRLHDGKNACVVSKNFRADNVEPMVWDFVSSLLKEPERVRAGLEAMIEQEREGLRGDPDSEVKMWHEKLAEVDEERRGYQRLAAKGLMTDEELDRALAELEQTHGTARRELESLSQRREKIVELERDRNALLESYVGMVPEALDSLTPQGRHQIYKMLRLRVVAGTHGRVEASGAFGDLAVRTSETWR